MKSPSRNIYGLIDIELFCLGKIILADEAKRAFKVLGEIFELRSGSYSEIGSTELLVIFPAAYFAYVLFHFFISFLNLFYWFKICRAVFAEWADIILGESIAFVDVAAYLANVAFLACVFRLRLDVFVIICVGH